jgi:hypothetical protein
VLDVAIPTSYGEGGENASRRLQAEVEAANSAPSIIPFLQNDCFVGRELELAELEAKLFSNKQSTMLAVSPAPQFMGTCTASLMSHFVTCLLILVVYIIALCSSINTTTFFSLYVRCCPVLDLTLAIVGPRGTGKSQLALEVAHRIRQTNKNCSVFWIDASDKDSLHQSYVRIAQKLGVLGWDDEKTDVRPLVKQRLAENIARQCLLVFDNAEDILLASSGSSTARATHLYDYLPQSELCSIIFTTTSSNTARGLASQNVVELTGLASDPALRMLDNYLSTPVSQSQQQEAKRLLQELPYLPLAIVQAAAYMNARSTTPKYYRSELDRHKELALEHCSNAPEDPLHSSNVKSPVATTLGLSLDEIRHSNSLAAHYLFLAACVDRKDIPLDLLDASTIRAREDAVKVLSRYALVTRRPAESALDLHRLVHRALHEWIHQQGWLLRWTEQVITRLLQVFPDNDHVNRSKWRSVAVNAVKQKIMCIVLLCCSCCALFNEAAAGSIYMTYL